MYVFIYILQIALQFRNIQQVPVQLVVLGQLSMTAFSILFRSPASTEYRPQSIYLKLIKTFLFCLQPAFVKYNQTWHYHFFSFIDTI